MIELNLNKTKLTEEFLDNLNTSSDIFCAARGSSILAVDTHTMKVLVYLDYTDNMIKLNTSIFSEEQISRLSETLAYEYNISCYCDAYYNEPSLINFIIPFTLWDDDAVPTVRRSEYQTLFENIVHNIATYLNNL